MTTHKKSLLLLLALLSAAAFPIRAAESATPESASWTQADAAHLLRRAAFSGTPEQQNKLLALGKTAAVDYLLTGNLPANTPPEAAPFPPVKLEPLHLEEAPTGAKPAAQKKKGAQDMREQWLDRMVRTDRPLEEKMSLFWHGLFTSGIGEVKAPGQMLAQNNLFHTHALGNYKTLTLAIVHDCAMLKYLNNNENVKGKPNENLARELCELFTMGEGKGYTEKDVLHAVGYLNPNRSHFRATDIWTTAQPESVAKAGWLGKYCDACCAGQDPGAAPAPEAAPAKKSSPDPATAIALEMEPPNALIGKEYIPLTFRSPENLAYKGARGNKAQSAFEKLNAGAPVRPDMDTMNDDDHRAPAIPMGTTGSLTQDDDAAKFLQRSALNARLYASRIQKSTAAIHNLAVYPTSAFAEDLKLVAQMIASDLPTRIYYVKLGGFDTHSGQTQRHEKLMAELAAGLSSFMDDLKALGQLDRVTVMTFSEFGRRVNENGSAGTDHGEAAPLLVLGGNINPGLHGTFPSLAPAKLHRGDVPYTTDFRSLYATLLQDWLKTDPQKILGKPFKTLDLIKPA